MLMIPSFTNQPIFFNQKTFRKNLESQPHVKVFKDAIHGAHKHFKSRFSQGESASALVHERARFVDSLLHYAWLQYDWDDDIALLAVGGYGRGELHPYSDVDILIVLDEVAVNKYDEKLKELITFLWDISLNIGSSVRTLKECIKLAETDISIGTAILEARTLQGPDRLRDKLLLATNANSPKLIKSFFDEKFGEQKLRHKKHNNTEYNLEPNIKNAPGGLRE